MKNDSTSLLGMQCYSPPVSVWTA